MSDEMANPDIGCEHFEARIRAKVNKDVMIADYRRAVVLSLHPDRIPSCSECRDPMARSFLCLECTNVGCYGNNHSADHADSTNHIIGM